MRHIVNPYQKELLTLNSNVYESTTYCFKICRFYKRMARGGLSRKLWSWPRTWLLVGIQKRRLCPRGQLGNYSLGLSPDQLATCRDDSQLSEWVTSCHNLNELGEKLNFTGFKLYKMIC